MEHSAFSERRADSSLRFGMTNFSGWLVELPESVRYREAADARDELAVRANGQRGHAFCALAEAQQRLSSGAVAHVGVAGECRDERCIAGGFYLRLAAIPGWQNVSTANRAGGAVDPAL